MAKGGNFWAKQWTFGRRIIWLGWKWPGRLWIQNIWYLPAGYANFRAKCNYSTRNRNSASNISNKQLYSIWTKMLKRLRDKLSIYSLLRPWMLLIAKLKWNSHERSQEDLSMQSWTHTSNFQVIGRNWNASMMLLKIWIKWKTNKWVRETLILLIFLKRALCSFGS